MLGDGGRQIVDASAKSMITLTLGFPLLAASLLLLRALRRDGRLWGQALPELLSEEILLLLLRASTVQKGRLALVAAGDEAFDLDATVRSNRDCGGGGLLRSVWRA